MLSLKPSELPIPKLHEYLLHAVAPRPIAFVSTIDKNGNVNLAPFSFFNCFGSNPPTLVYSPALSGRTGATKNTHDNVMEVPECVVNIAHYEMLYQMNLAAGMYPKGVNEFAKAGLTAVASETVKPPRVAECYVQMECEVKQVIETGHGGGAGNLVICEVKMIHINEKVLTDDGSIDPFKMDYIARMGQQYWCRVQPENIFRVPGFKMLNEVGLGFDRLPDSIKHSPYLTGNEIAQVATLHDFPAPAEINEAAALLTETSPQKRIEQAHQMAKAEIAKGEIAKAFAVLMAVA
ncbi:MAG TPA: flavin reductase family protein [Chitinophagales bacterium]|nr:flavin reductase family protein [Chitinophagales bacterium]